jgi:hypothetical protein
MMIINISQEAPETSFLLSVYQNMGVFHHDVGVVEVDFKKDETDWECGTYSEKKIP